MVKRLVINIHSWIGLLSGLIIIFLGISGCILVFEQEIKSFTEPFQFIKSEESIPYLSPSQLKNELKKQFPEFNITGVSYNKTGKSTILYCTDKGNKWFSVYVNPYNGKIIHCKDQEKDFFRIVLKGHLYLWLSPTIGRQIVGYSTLAFIVALISGIFLWWPKNKKVAKKNLKINFKANIKRLNYDLHNVLGFYICIVGLIIALTGMVWAFDWFAKAYYTTITNGDKYENYRQPLSNTSSINTLNPEMFPDQLWKQMKNEYADQPQAFIQIMFPLTPDGVYAVYYNPKEKTYYQREIRFFDQYTLLEITSSGIYKKTYQEAGFGNKLFRMNYDIHTGAIGGLAGKIIVFFVSLICASLPITGIILWINKKKVRKQIC